MRLSHETRQDGSNRLDLFGKSNREAKSQAVSFAWVSSRFWEHYLICLQINK